MEVKDLGLVVIDYLQLINSSSSNNDRNQEISAISRGLKILARELNVPIIALSQLSRKVEERGDKRPMLSDLRDSGAIEQDADIVMFIHREDYYNKEKKMKTVKFKKLTKKLIQKVKPILLSQNKETALLAIYSCYSNQILLNLRI